MKFGGEIWWKGDADFVRLKYYIDITLTTNVNNFQTLSEGLGFYFYGDYMYTFFEKLRVV